MAVFKDPMGHIIEENDLMKGVPGVTTASEVAIGSADKIYCEKCLCKKRKREKVTTNAPD